MKHTYGYARVSTREQKEDRQMIALMEMQVLSFVAENERCNIRQRQREGIEAARRKGVRFGRTKKELSDNFDTAFAGWLSGDTGITAMGALALSLGIAIQNFPEGAIISMPLRAEGVSRRKAFLYGTLSGAVEPVGAALTILAAGFVIPLLPYLLSFAAGAMVYVVVEELIPEMSEGKHSNVGTLLFAAGFTVMMALDVALG